MNNFDFFNYSPDIPVVVNYMVLLQNKMSFHISHFTGNFPFWIASSGLMVTLSMTVLYTVQYLCVSKCISVMKSVVRFVEVQLHATSQSAMFQSLKALHIVCDMKFWTR